MNRLDGNSRPRDSHLTISSRADFIIDYGVFRRVVGRFHQPMLCRSAGLDHLPVRLVRSGESGRALPNLSTPLSKQKDFSSSLQPPSSSPSEPPKHSSITRHHQDTHQRPRERTRSHRDLRARLGKSRDQMSVNHSQRLCFLSSLYPGLCFPSDSIAARAKPQSAPQSHAAGRIRAERYLRKAKN